MRNCNLKLIQLILLSIFLTVVAPLGSASHAAIRPAAVKALFDFCSGLLAGKPVEFTKGLEWVYVNDTLGKVSMALKATPEKSYLITRMNNEKGDLEEEIIDDEDIRFVSFSNRYLLHRKMISHSGAPGHETFTIFEPRMLNGRMVLQAMTTTKPGSFPNLPILDSSVTILAGPRFIYQLNHIPTVNLSLADQGGFQLVPVDENVIDPITYLKFVLNMKVPISLRGEFFHDMFTHALGFNELLKDEKYWPPLKRAMEILVEQESQYAKLSRKKRMNYEMNLIRINRAIEFATAHQPGETLSEGATKLIDRLLGEFEKDYLR